jgi:hypothetical protein
MKTSLTHYALIPAICTLLLALYGCEKEVTAKGEGDRAYLRRGSVKEELDGWVAVPHTQPEFIENKEKGIKYVVVRANNVVPYSSASWVAITPKFFEKLSGIKVEPPKEAANIENRVVLRAGKSVPKYAVGWVAVPFSQPYIEKSKNIEMAQLLVNQIISKEMHGWVAIERDVLAKLVESRMSTGPGSEVFTPRSSTPKNEGDTKPADTKVEPKPEAAPEK